MSELLFKDKFGRILGPEEVDELPIWEIESREIHCAASEEA